MAGPLIPIGLTDPTAPVRPLVTPSQRAAQLAESQNRATTATSPQAAPAAAVQLFDPTGGVPFQSFQAPADQPDPVGLVAPSGVSSPFQNLPAQQGTPPAYTGVQFGQSPDRSGRLVGNLPGVQQAFVEKYQRLADQLKDVPDPVRNALVKLDYQRVQKGQSPISDEDTAKVIDAAVNKREVTKTPDRNPLNVVGNAVGDLREILTSLPRLPMALVHEAGALPHLGEEYAKQIEAGENPLSALAKSPGFRLIPGAYTLGNVAGGHLDELAKHPLMTGLDVLPAASEAAGLTKAGRIAAEEGAMSPIRAALTRRVAEAGDEAVMIRKGPLMGQDSKLTYNRLGKAAQSVAESKIGEYLQTALGSAERDVTRHFAQGSAWKGELIDPNGPSLDSPNVTSTTEMKQVAEVARAGAKAMVGGYKEFGITPERLAELSQDIHGWAGATDLAPNERAFFDTVIAPGEAALAQRKLADGLLVEHGGEYYDVAAGNKLNSALERMNRTRAKVNGDVVSRLDKMLQADPHPRVQALRDGLADGSLSLVDANREVTNMFRGKTRLGSTSHVGEGGPPSNQTLAGLGNMRAQLRDAMNAEKAYEGLRKSTPPPRFYDLIRDKAREQVVSQFVKRGESVDDINRAILTSNYQAFPDITDPATGRILVKGLRREIDDTVGEVSRTWQDMADAGANPVYVHRVTNEQARGLLSGTKRIGLVPISSAKPRAIWDVTPHLDDITISLTHEASELLDRMIQEHVMDSVIGTFGRDAVEAAQELEPAARQIAASGKWAHVVAPGEDAVAAILDQLYKKRYMELDPSEFLPLNSNLRGKYNGKIVVPKTIGTVLQQLSAPGGVHLTSALQPIMGAFRTAVLPLSPRWHVNNVVGNTVTLGAEIGPQNVPKYLMLARDVLKGDAADIVGELRRGLGSHGKEYAIAQADVGMSTKRFWDKLDNHPAVKARLEEAKALTGKVVDRSFELNAMFDDMTRVAAYLYGKDKALAAGMSEDAAIQTGLNLTRKVLQQWDNYTPIERTVIRQLFPFYGFMRHIMSFTMRYPFDHPMRVAIMGSLARTELEDHLSGLPERFLNTVWLGRMNSHGDQKVLQFTGSNPFADVANMFTLAGFASASNPMISTVLQQLGVDTMTGGPDMYPELEFDPVTGKMVARHKALLPQLVQNVVPQAGVLTALAGQDDAYNQLARRDPQAANRMLMAGLGLPTSVRTYNIPQERMKRELSAQDAQSAALAQALKTGDFGEAMAYPALRPYLAQIATLRSQGKLAAYTPDQQASPRLGLEGVLAAIGGTTGR